MKEYFYTATKMEDGNLTFILLYISTFKQYINFIDYILKKFQATIVKQDVGPDAITRIVSFGNMTLVFNWDDWEIISIVAKGQEQEELVKKIIEDTKLLKFDEK